jgi:hypothetical protein
MVELGSHQAGSAVRYDFSCAVGNRDIENARFTRRLFDQLLKLLGIWSAHHHRGPGACADKTDYGLSLVEKVFGHDPLFPLQVVGREEKDNGNEHANGSGQNPGGGIGKGGGNYFCLVCHKTLSKGKAAIGMARICIFMKPRLCCTSNYCSLSDLVSEITLSGRKFIFLILGHFRMGKK